MKKIYTLFIAVLLGITGFAQTAANFSCTDCAGVLHDFFSELDGGKVIVLCWVMPCSASIGSSTAAYNLVQNYQSTNPGRVFFYLADDLANTSCASLGSWANTNNMPLSSSVTRFSDASINMKDYGSTGMPKIVVVGGPSHTVYYNTNGVVNNADLQNAINTALASTTGIEEKFPDQASISFLPNPANNVARLHLKSKELSAARVELFNLIGNKVAEIFNGTIAPGDNNIDIRTSGYSNGIYFIKIFTPGQTKISKLIISH